MYISVCYVFDLLYFSFLKLSILREAF
uniref:Uncharacterized protein n=1 Tax=Anguilla anguilla TaxID=7936 RepID=A0A0E9PZ54_ANGAN